MATVKTPPPEPQAGATALDGAVVSRDFPLLTRAARSGDRLAYLDSAATAQKPRQVLEAMRETYETAYANVHRGVYHVAAEATERFEAARATIARFIGAASPREVIFTRGTTEAINLVAYSWGRANLGPGDVVVSTELEHHSNFVPWQQLARAQGAEVAYLPLDEDGAPQLDQLDAVVAGRTLKLVAITHVSNSIGTVNDIPRICELARARGALVLVDGAQAAPHRAIDVQALGCDFYAFSGHKLPGPTGIGVLWGREQLLQQMPPFQFGGEMIRSVSVDETTFNTLPWKFEAGTPAIVEAVGLAAAIDYLEGLGMDRVSEHERQLIGYAYDALSEVEGITIYGPRRGVERGGILSFAIAGAHPHDIASVLDTVDVCVRAGHHCTQPLMKRMGVPATARASVYVYNTRDDVDRLVAGLGAVRTTLGL